MIESGFEIEFLVANSCFSLVEQADNWAGCLPFVEKGLFGRDNLAFHQQPWLQNRNGIIDSAALNVVTTSGSAVVLCMITVHLPLAWD